VDTGGLRNHVLGAGPVPPWERPIFGVIPPNLLSFIPFQMQLCCTVFQQLIIAAAYAYREQNVPKIIRNDTIQMMHGSEFDIQI